MMKIKMKGEKMLKKPFIIFFTILVFTTVLTGMWGETNDSKANEYEGPEIKNVILLIGDGMGPAYTTAYRYLKDDPSTPLMEDTSFDPHLVGMASTYSADKEEGSITDSAAAATALSTGIKTYNGAIGVDIDRQPVETVLERAKAVGKSTGLVTTVQINHATPAGFGAHSIHRDQYDAIAADYYDGFINGKHKVDVMFGGGEKYFTRDDRHLANEFQKDGYSYLTNRTELLNDDNEQALGLFASDELPKMIDRPDNVPSLKEMTVSAIERLNKNKDGFFLMSEGGAIDKGGHDNDIVSAMSEMQDFEDAFQAAIDFAEEDKHTLVIATADHETGGLAIGSNGSFSWDPDPLKKAKRTPKFMAKQIKNGASVEETLEQYIDFELTDKEIQSVKDVKGGSEGDLHRAINRIFDKRTNTGWTTGWHTGVDVPVYAYGPGKELFTGKIENTDIANHIFQIFGEGTALFQTSRITAIKANPGTDAKISANFTNFGSTAGQEKIDFYFDGDFVESKTIKLEPGENQRVTFTVENVKSGTHEVQIGHLRRNLQLYDSIPGDITDEVESIHADEDYPAKGEIDENLIDRNDKSKWLSHKNTAEITMKLFQPEAVTNYSFTSANDFPGRDPQDWTLYGSNDGENWTKLDVQSGVKFEERFQRKIFKFENDEKYSFYRFDMTKNSGERNTQLAEIALSNWIDNPPPSSSADIIESVQNFEKEGAFTNSQAAHALRVHLMAVQRFEEKGAGEKVAKHLNGFKQLLHYQREDELISEKAYSRLKADTDYLIKKYQ